MKSLSLLEGLPQNIIDMGVGSAEFQIASLTSRLENVKKHNEENKKDYSAKYGLMKIVSRRERLLKYLSSKYNDRYKAIVKHLGLREKKYEK